MIELKPHTLESGVLIHIPSAPSCSLGIRAVQQMTDFSWNDWNPAEAAVESVARQDVRSSFSVWHSGDGSVRSIDMRQRSFLNVETMN
jgi:hypothetical protein